MNLIMNFFNSPIYHTADISKNLNDKHSNSKRLLIVCTNFNESNSDFLNKIMKAVNTNLEADAVLVDVDKFTELHFSTSQKSNDFEKLILFGVEPASIGLHLNLTKYKCTTWNGINILCAESLEQIASDKIKKAALWRELQKMFEIG